MQGAMVALREFDSPGPLKAHHIGPFMKMNKENCTKGRAFVNDRGVFDRCAVKVSTEHGDLTIATADTEHLVRAAKALGEEPPVGYGQPMDAANAELIAEAFNTLHETGYTPRELADTLAYLSGKLGSLCDAMPIRSDDEHSDLEMCRHIIDDMQAKLEEYQPATPA